MRISALSLVLVFLAFGCSKKDDVSKNEQPSQSAAVAPDNSGRNERDRNDATKTAGDQSESEADRTISQNIGRRSPRTIPFRPMAKTSKSSPSMAS